MDPTTTGVLWDQSSKGAILGRAAYARLSYYKRVLVRQDILLFTRSFSPLQVAKGKVFFHRWKKRSGRENEWTRRKGRTREMREREREREDF